MFVIGNIIMFLWLLYVKVNLFWSIAIIIICFIVCIVIARLVAETGIPLISVIDFRILYFIKFLPISLTSRISILVGGMCDFIFAYSTRTAPIVALTYALGIDKNASPKKQKRFTYLFIVVCVLGLIICGAATVNMAYHHINSLDGVEKPLSWWSSGLIARVHYVLNDYVRGSWGNTQYSEVSHFSAGFIIAIVLEVLSLAIPQWPLHPVGLLMIGTWYLGKAWISILIGWTLKVAILRFGGARAYNIAKPLFIGVILGEIVAVILWAAVPLLLIWMGHDPADVGRLMVIPR